MVDRLHKEMQAKEVSKWLNCLAQKVNLSIIVDFYVLAKLLGC